MFYASEGFKIVAGLKTIFHTKNCEVFHIDSKQKRIKVEVIKCIKLLELTKIEIKFSFETKT
jgi:hypothetical protein